MSYEIPGFSWTLVAGEDLSDSQYCGVDIELNTGDAVLPAAGGSGVGVVRNKPTDGTPATIVSSGVTKVHVGITGLKAGNNVTVDDDGTFIQASNGDYHWGVAVKSNVAGEIGTVLLQLGGAKASGS